MFTTATLAVIEQWAPPLDPASRARFTSVRRASPRARPASPVCAASATPELLVGTVTQSVALVARSGYNRSRGSRLCSWLNRRTRRGADWPGLACSLRTRSRRVVTRARMAVSRHCAMARRPPPTLDARPDDPASGDAAAYGLDRCLDAVVKVEFGEDAGDVVVDGVGAERELVGDVVIASAAGEPFEDL